MTDIEQAQFIDRIKKALNRKQEDSLTLADLIQSKPDAAERALVESILQRDPETLLKLLDQMTVVGKSLNLVVSAKSNPAAITAAISQIAATKESEWSDKKSIVAWDHPLVNSLDLSSGLKPLGIPVYFSEPQSGTGGRAPFRRQAENALIGVTSADYGLAQSATLVMKTRVGQPRCVSLLPSIHIAVVRLEQVLADLNELYTLLKWAPDHRSEGLTDAMIFITGPSKTADIEATLVHGAHGPRELYIFVLK